MKRPLRSPCLASLILTLGMSSIVQAKKHPAAPPPPEGAVCDSPYPDPQGNVSFTCHGLTDDQLRLLPNLTTLMNRVLNAGVDGPRLDAQSDAIVKSLQAGPAPVPTAISQPIVLPSTTVASIPIENKKPEKEKPKEKEKEIFTYDYRGYKTSSLIGPMLILGDNGESKEYQKLLTLQKAGEWKKLLKDSNHEIKKVPDWLTPYAFKAVALQHLGDKPGAIAALEYVDQHSAGNPDYDQVRHLLHQLSPATP